jgi:uncharacterized protein with HEPN domain
MTRSHLLYLNDITESIEKIQRYTKGLSYKKFHQSDMVVDATVRNLEVIGEASNHIPSEILEAHPEVPWKLMKSMRNILIHEYFGVDLEIVWKTIQGSLPELLIAVRKVISEEAKKD